MTDTQLLLCVVIFFYLSGRCTWCPAGTVAFRSVFFGRYRAIQRPSLLGNRRGSLLFCDPFVPLKPIYLVDPAKVYFSPHVLMIRQSSEFSGVSSALVAIHYDEIEAVEVSERVVRINARVEVRCRTATAARSLKSYIEKLQHRSSKGRAGEINKLIDRAFDWRKAKRCFRKSAKVLHPLRFACNSWLFAIPYLYLLITLRFGHAVATLLLLVCFEIAAVQIGIMFYRAHAIHFASDRRARIGEMLKFILCPPTVFRSVDAISSDLLAEFDTIVVGYLLLHRRDFAKLCSRSLRALTFSRPHVENQEQADCVAWFRSSYQRSQRHFLETIGVSVEQCLAAPQPIDSLSKSYCSQCEAQYNFDEGICPECEIAVTSFTKPPITSHAT